MNTSQYPIIAGRIPRVRLVLGLFLVPFVSASIIQAQTATITVDANNVVRDIPAGIGGVCAAGEFWNTYSPNYRDDLVKAQVGVVRINGFPLDTTNTAKLGSVEAMDIKVAQILNAGATPLFIQALDGDNPIQNPNQPANTVFRGALLRLDGTEYPTTDTTTPIQQRIATNLAFLVNRYRSAPFNLTTQYWEIGNEPDIPLNYATTPEEYVVFFKAAHNQLVASGLRNNVLLAGPVISYDYGYNAHREAIMHEFLTECAGMVDIVTRHVYGAIDGWEDNTPTPYELLNSPRENHHFDSSYLGGQNRGERNLQNAMNSRGNESAGTGVTEMNLYSQYRLSITQGLWFLLANHHALYNPRSLVTNGFQFDRYADSNPGGGWGFYDGVRNRSYPYWATYIHGVLTGDQVLAKTSSDSHLVVTGSRDDRYIYVQVINRNTASLTATVTLNNSGGVGAPTVFNLSSTQTPLTGSATTLGTTFSRTFAPMSVQIFRFPRNSAPPVVSPPAPPTTTHLTTSFDSAVTNTQTYAVNFTPVVSGGRLQLTSTIANARAAVVFNGQPLTASRNRAQIRFGFRADDVNGEGFVFGAYSATPAAVGNGGAALGYQGQNNRLWGVKIDNNPDQIAVLSTAVNARADGWATQAIAPFNGLDMFVVIDYDGAARTVRARLYQGTNDAGTLRADVTNRLGNPATLPAGTVFGFTAATSASVQPIYINELTIRADNATGGTFVVGQEVIVDNPAAVRTGTWVLNQNMTPGFYGTTYDHDADTNKGDCTATYTPTLTGTGYRDVYVRFCSGSNRASNARYTVNHAGGSETVLQSQRTLGGQWVKIGTWNFNHGTTGNVVLSNLATDGVVIADAIRFVNVTAPGGTFVVGQEVIVDNPAAVRSGPWVLNQNMTSGFYGTTYDHDGGAAHKGECTATYTPALVGTGPRQVYVRYCGGSNRSSNARYIVSHAGGTAPAVEVDQRTLGGQWVLIGTWVFAHGSSGNVVLDNTGTDGVVIADAVRFVNVAP